MFKKQTYITLNFISNAYNIIHPLFKIKNLPHPKDSRILLPFRTIPSPRQSFPGRPVKPGIRRLKSGTWNLGSGIWDLESGTWNMEPEV